jgi:putative Ca2+/H+ antiporter (TMEM165/GDT1 family)
MPPSETISVFLASFTLVGLAEIGDKSQIVCMVLASRHRHWPVLLGASAAFLMLNTLAVVFGASIATLVPERVAAAVVALLFGVFGIHALLAQPENEPVEVTERQGRSVFLTTMSLIFLAEFGDKTQLAVAGLASNAAPLPVWVGATIALLVLSALGVWIGRTLLQRIPTNSLQRFAGVIFLIFAAIAGWRVIN